MKLIKLRTFLSLLMLACGAVFHARAQQSAPSTWGSIPIDGSFNGWASVPLAWTEQDYVTAQVPMDQLYICNDSSNLYFMYTVYGGSESNITFITQHNIYVNGQNNNAQGYVPQAGSISSDMLIEGGAGYQEAAGVFNGGAINNLNWQCAPTNGTQFECAFSRGCSDAAGGAPVITANTIEIEFQLLDSGYNFVAWDADVSAGGFYGFSYTFYNQVTITNQPVNTTQLISNPASFTVGASGTSPLYQWYTNNSGSAGPITGATSPSYTNTAVQFTDNGAQYYCVLTNNAGAVTSSVVTLTVTNGLAPTITSPPLPETVGGGRGAVFSVAVGGTGPFEYQWYTNNVNGVLAGGVGASYTNGACLLTDSGAQYFVIVTNLYGAVTSGVAVLTVTNIPVSILSQPAGVVAGPGVAAGFTVVAAGTPPLYYQWYTNNASGLLAGATSASYTNPAVVLSTDNGAQYYVVITNSGSSITSSVALLVVDPVYRSSASGFWTNPAVWQVSADGVNWGAATAYPSNGSAYSATIASPNIITNRNSIVMPTVLVSSGGTLTYTNVPGTSVGPGLVFGGDFVNNGSFTRGKGLATMTFEGNLTNNGIWPAKVTGDVTILAGTNVFVAGADPILDYNLTVTNNAMVTFLTAPTLSGDNYANYGYVVVATPGSILYGVTTAFTSGPGSTIEIDNGLATLGVSTAAFNNITVNYADADVLSAGFETINGNLWVRQTGGSIFTASTASAAFNIGGNVVVDGGSCVLDTRGETVTIGGNLQVDGGSCVLNSGSVVAVYNLGGDVVLDGGALDLANDNTTTANSALNVSGNWWFNGGAVVRSAATADTKSNVALNGTGRQIGGSATNGAFADALSIGGSYAIGGSLATLTLSNNVTIVGSLANSACNINVISNWVNNAGAGGFTDSAGTVTFAGSGAQGIGGSAATTFNNLTISKSGSVTVTNAGTTVNRNLSLVGGTVAGAGNLTLANNAGVVRNAGSLSGTPAFGANISVTYTGNTAVTSGPELPMNGGSGLVNNLTINKTGGVTLAISTVVNGTLTLTSGILTALGNNGVSLAQGGGILGGGVNSYVYGALQATFGPGSGQSFNFPVGSAPSGSATNYAPVSVTALGVGAGGTLTVQTTNVAHPDIASSSFVQPPVGVERYWTLTLGGGLAVTNYTLSLNYEPGNLDAGAVPADFGVEEWDGSAWAALPVGGFTATSITSPGSALVSGDFAVAETGVQPGQTNAMIGIINGVAGVTFAGVPGDSYIVQRSTNLAPGAGAGWVNLSTNTAPNSGLFEIQDNFNDLGATPPHAFYRLLPQ